MNEINVEVILQVSQIFAQMKCILVFSLQTSKQHFEVSI